MAGVGVYSRELSEVLEDCQGESGGGKGFLGVISTCESGTHPFWQGGIADLAREALPTLPENYSAGFVGKSEQREQIVCHFCHAIGLCILREQIAIGDSSFCLCHVGVLSAGSGLGVGAAGGSY